MRPGYGGDVTTRSRTPGRFERAPVPVQDRALGRSPDVGVVEDACDRVAHVAPQELLGLLHGAAEAPVLVAEVLALHGLRREVEVEVAGAPRRTGRARQDDTPEVGVRGVLDACAEGQELGQRARCEPAREVRGGRAGLDGHARRRERDHVGEEQLTVVLGGLHAREQAVERGHVAAGRGRSEGIRLDKRRSRARERIPHEAAGAAVTAEEDLDELRDELAEIRMEPVDVLRPLPLGKLRLRPRQLEVDLLVEGSLSSHGVHTSPRLAPDLPRRL